MSIIRKESRIYEIVSGMHMGKTCVIRSFGRYSDETKVAVVFADCRSDVTQFIKRGALAEQDTPGWERDSPGRWPCTQKEFLATPDHSMGIRETLVSHAAVAEKGDVLVTGEIVVEEPRIGCNSSVLLRLSKSGWVELAPRLPLALQDNQNFKFPIELVEGERLATGCLIAKNSVSTKINWTDIYLDRPSCCIDVPSCIPLALL